MFAVLVLVTRLVCLDHAGNSSFWPANAAVVVAVLLLPPGKSTVVAALCFLVNLALNSLTPYRPFNSVLFCALNLGVAYLAAFLTRSLCGATTDFSRFRRLLTFGVIAFVASGCEATLGELLEWRSDLEEDVLADLAQWTLCDGFGLLLATPAILFAMRRPIIEDPCDAPPLERWLLLAVTVALTFASFSQSNSPLFLTIYPALILTAFRAGPSWVLASVLLTAIVASGMTAHGLGPLATLSTSGALLKANMVQPYLLSLFFSAVPANNALGERSRTLRRLRLTKSALEHSATHDGLTTLINRELFQRRLRGMLSTGTPCAVLLIDLDHFKEVNDTMGHRAGDELLKVFSRRILRVVAAGVSVARLGGDEFAVLMACDPAADAARDLGESIADSAREPFHLVDGLARVSASIGVALSAGVNVATDEILRRADLALYAVKAAGRDGCRLFGDELDHAPAGMLSTSVGRIRVRDAEQDMVLHV